MEIDVKLILALIGNAITIISFVWYLSNWKTLLMISIAENKRDIDALGVSLRREIKQRDRNILIKLNTVVEYIESKSDFRSPQMKDDDE